MEKCENRCATLGLKSNSPSPLKEPLEVADRLVAENNGRHYEIVDSILQQVEAKRTERKNKVFEKMDVLGKRLEETKISGKSGRGTSADMRIMLLGYRRAGKTAAGRIILGDDNLHLGHSVVSVKADAHVSGRHVSVVRASEWSREQLLCDTAELTKQEITLSLTLCPPGPHCILVVLNLKLKFSEVSRRAVQEHLELLTEDAWRYSMVLFTCKEDLADATIEQYIESEGKPLHWLIERCGYRYHVLNTKSRDERQCRELFEKIDCMALGTDNGHFKPESGISSKLEDRRREEIERAEARRLAVQKQRQELQEKLKQVMS
ncbi:GTPase IMAP family member 9-like [Engraulis encrasicolus]|uniref:GTPase IMAP family member 9-like n=1 Tax=Engraulis encrasicolus TaxID=184585 RepID=UPI002FD5664D